MEDTTGDAWPFSQITTAQYPASQLLALAHYQAHLHLVLILHMRAYALPVLLSLRSKLWLEETERGNCREGCW